MFYRVSGAAFNPNVALALLLCNVLSLQRFVFYVGAQFVGAIVACAILDGLSPNVLVVSVGLSSGVNIAQGICKYRHLVSGLLAR
jgi:aquaporin related protein